MIVKIPERVAHTHELNVVVLAWAQLDPDYAHLPRTCAGPVGESGGRAMSVCGVMRE